MTFFDFNSAAEQANYDLIPKGTIARVRMTIKPGGYDDASQGWTGGFATCSQTTGSVYLNCEFVVLDGPFARRKMWSLIGLYSAKGAEWTNMGRTFIKAILNSARGINPSDNSPAAQNARRIWIRMQTAKTVCWGPAVSAAPASSTSLLIAARCALGA